MASNIQHVETHQEQQQLQLLVRALPVDSVVRTAYTNVDRFSAQWVRSWGCDGTGLTNFEWEFATAWYFGLPVPALAPYVGRSAEPDACWMRTGPS